MSSFLYQIKKKETARETFSLLHVAASTYIYTGRKLGLK